MEAGSVVLCYVLCVLCYVLCVLCYVLCVLLLCFAFADAARCVPTGMTDFCSTFFDSCNDFSMSKNQNIEKTQKSQK